MVNHDITPVQLVHPPFIYYGVQCIDCRVPPPLFFSCQFRQTVEAVIMWFIVKVPRFSCPPPFFISVEGIGCRSSERSPPPLHFLLSCQMK